MEVCVITPDELSRLIHASVEPLRAEIAALRHEIRDREAGEQLLNQRQVAQLLGICVRQVRRLRNAGKFPEPSLSTGRILRWRRRQIESFLKERSNG